MNRPLPMPLPSHPLPSGPWLALDTSGPVAHVALVALEPSSPRAPEGVPDVRVLASAARPRARHSAGLLSACDEVLGRAGMRPGDLGALVAGAGPGSFTGLRVGLAVAKALAFATGRPLALVSSLQALAIDLLELAPRSLPGEVAPVALPCIDAGKGEVHVQRFIAQHGRLVATRAATRVPAAALRNGEAPDALIVVGGSGLDRHRDDLVADLSSRWGNALLAPAGCGPTARAAALLAIRQFLAEGPNAPDDAVPSYGRPPDITLPTSGRAGI